MRAARASRIGVAVLAAAGCTTPPIAAGVLTTVERLVVAPYATHEACASMARGDRLDWRYESSAPLGFEIHYREGGAVLAPVVRDASRTGSGTFEAHEPRRYCAAWDGGAGGAILGYRLLVRAAPR